MQSNIRNSYSLRDVFLKGVEVDGVERDIHRAIVREKGLDSMGLLVPVEVFCRDLSITGSASQGASLVESTLQTNVADVVRPYSAVVASGARVISNLTGNFVWPRRISYTPAGWQTGENTVDTATGMFFGQLVLTPCRLPFEVRVSKQLLEQAADRSLEQFLAQSLLKDLGSTLDLACLTGAGPGTGTSGAPLGLLAQAENTGNPPYDYAKLSPGVTFGGPATWANILQQRYNVEQNDVVDDGTFGWVGSEKAKLKMSQDPIISGFPKFLWQDDKIADFPARHTSNLSSTDQLIFGRWSDFLIALWAMDVFSDPITFASNNQIRLIVNLLGNCATLRGLSFSRSEDSAAQ